MLKKNRSLLSLILLFCISSVSYGRVSALGFIEPKDGVIHLAAAPSQGTTTTLLEQHVTEGQSVKAGQILATLNHYPALKATVKQAETEVAILDARLKKLTAGASNAEINVQQAKIARIKAELNVATKECSRAKVLHNKKAISTSEQEDKCLQQHVLNNQLQEAKAFLSQIKEVRKVDVAVSEAELDNAKALLEKSRIDLDSMLLRAPFNARILKWTVKTGELIGSEGILQIAKTGNMWVRAEVYETKINEIQIAQKAIIRSDIIQKPLHGTVQQIGEIIGKNRLDETQTSSNSDEKVIEVKIKLDDSSSAKVSHLINHQVTVIIDTDGHDK